MSAEKRFWLVSGAAVSGAHVEVITYTVISDTEEWAKGAATERTLDRFPGYGIRSLKATDLTECVRGFCAENPQPLAEQPK